MSEEQSNNMVEGLNSNVVDAPSQDIDCLFELLDECDFPKLDNVWITIKYIIDVLQRNCAGGSNLIIFDNVVTYRKLIVQIFAYNSLNCGQIDTLLRPIDSIVQSYQESILMEEESYSGELPPYHIYVELLIIRDAICQGRKMCIAKKVTKYARWYHLSCKMTMQNSHNALVELMLELNECPDDYKSYYLALDCLSKIIKSINCETEFKLLASNGFEHKNYKTITSLPGFTDIFDNCLRLLPSCCRQLKIIGYKWLSDMIAFVQLSHLPDVLQRNICEQLEERICYFRPSYLRSIFHSQNILNDPLFERLYSNYQECLKDITNVEYVTIGQELYQRNSQTKQPFRSVFLPTGTCDFVARQDLLTAIDQHFQKNKHCTLTGYSGVGKTTLAIEYARCYQDNYDLICYFDATNLLTLQRDFVRLCTHMSQFSVIYQLRHNLYEQLKCVLHNFRYGMYGGDDLIDDIYLNHGMKIHPLLDSLVTVTIDTIQTHHRALLIFDNIKEIQLIQNYLPGGEDIHVLRVLDGKKNECVEALQVNAFDNDTLKQSLVNFNYDPEVLQTTHIYQLMLKCPLILCNIISYMKRSGYSIEQIYKQIPQMPSSDLDSTSNCDSCINAAITFIVMSPAMIKIFTLHTSAKELLIFMSFSSPCHVDIGYLLHYMNFRDFSKADLNEALDILHSYSMINKSSTGYRIHPIIQIAVRNRIKASGEYGEYTFNILSYSLQNLDKNEADAIKYKVRTLDNKLNLVIHSEYCSQYAIDYKSSNELVAKVNLHLAKFYLYYLLYDEAKKYCEHSLKFFLIKYGELNFFTCKCYDILAKIDYALGNFASALQYANMSLENRKQSLGLANVQLADNYRELAKIYSRLLKFKDAGDSLYNAQNILENANSPEVAGGHFDLATFCCIHGNDTRVFPSYCQALNCFQNLLGENSYAVANVYLGIARIHWTRYELWKSDSYLRKAQQILHTIACNQHESIVNLLFQSGLIAYSKGKYESSMELNRKALTIAIKNYGSNHYIIARIRDVIGDIYKKLDQTDEALRSYNASLTLKNRLFSCENADIAITYVKLGGLYRQIGKFDKALQYAKKALAIQRAIFGNNHIILASIYDDLGRTYTGIRRYHLAHSYINTALQIKVAAYGEGHVSLASSYNNLGESYCCEGKHADSLSHFATAVTIARNIADRDTFELAKYYNNNAVAIYNTRLYRHGNKEILNQALNLFNESLKIKIKARGEYSPESQECYQNMADFYVEVGKDEEDTGLVERYKALEYYKKTLDIQTKLKGEDCFEIVLTCNSIANLLIDLKRYEEALDYHKKMLNAYKKRLGDEHIDVAMCYYRIGENYKCMKNTKKAVTNFEKALAICATTQNSNDGFKLLIKEKMKEVNNEPQSKFCNII